MYVIGHRGAKGLAPENTLTSLQRAVDCGVDRVEFDVRVTKDGVPVLHHDAEISTEGKQYPIQDHPYADLRSYTPDLATLDAALAAIGHKVPLYIEVKPHEPIEPLVAVIKKHRAKLLDPWLASFNQETLLALHKELPDFCTVVLERWSGIRASRRARQLATNKICMKQKWLWWGFIRQVTRGGRELYAYTVNDPAKARRWARHGLAGVVTDYPDRFQSRHPEH